MFLLIFEMMCKCQYKNVHVYFIIYTNQGREYNDKSIIHSPRQVSCAINRTFVNWGKVGHNIPQTRINTTVLTTKG